MYYKHYDRCNSKFIKVPMPNKNVDADFIADLSFGAGVTISDDWYLLNLNLGVGLDTSPSIGFNVNTRVIGSTLLTPVKPTLQTNFVEMINNHLYSSPY